MKRLLVVGLAAVAALFVSVAVTAQPVPSGGLRYVTHDGTLTGSGTTGSPLSSTYTGDITGIYSGSGLLGSADSGSATLAIDPTYTQRRISATTCYDGGS